MNRKTYENIGLHEWCQIIDPLDDTNFLERLKSTGIMEKKHNFNIYLRKRTPNQPLKHVKKWKNYLPDIDEIADATGPGEAVIDFEVLFGRYGGKKKRSKRTTIRFAESFKKTPDIRTCAGNKPQLPFTAFKPARSCPDQYP